MRSIKPGRGPSLIGGILAGFVALAGLGGIITAFSLGAPWFSGLLCIGLTIAALCIAVYHIRNAVSNHRISAFDVVESREEPDPLKQRFGAPRYCRQCGVSLPGDANFCSGRGVRIDR